MLLFLLLTAETRALEVGVKIGMFGPLIPLFSFVEGSVTLGERGQNYQHELGIRYAASFSRALGLGVLELVNRSWFSRATPEPDCFGERLSFALEYSPYLVLGREPANDLQAGFAGLNLKGCVSLLLGEAPDEVYHELLFSDGIYISLVTFEQGLHFTLDPSGDEFSFILYIPGWLSLGYGAGLRL